MAGIGPEDQARSVFDESVFPLHDLAMDCLRLSMHFFHPIQQCAQQVYHTAVPLSPTSSELHKLCLQSIIDNQLSHITTFLRAPHTWGPLLRTIDTRPRQLTCITTSAQRIISACEDTIHIYDAITGVLQQSICVLDTVVKIHSSADGSVLFLAHPSSVTMWDIQTGGLIHAFTAPLKINDIAVSITHIACGSSDGSVMFWNIHTKEGNGFENDQPVVTINWLSTQDLVVATQGTLYIHNIIDGKRSVWFSTSKHIWGMVYLENKLLVGISWQSPGTSQEQCFFVPMTHTGIIMEWADTYSSAPVRIDEESQLQLEEDVKQWHVYGLPQSLGGPRFVYNGKLEGPILVDKKIACITPPSGVQFFNTTSHTWADEKPVLLGAARSVAISLGRNIVVQTNTSIQILSVDALTGGEVHRDICPSHIYPLGKKHIICIQSDRHLIILKLETLQELHPDNNSSQLWSLLKNLSPFHHASSLTNQLPFACASLSYGLVAKFGILRIMQAWQSGTPLPEGAEVADEDVLLSGLSPMCTLAVTVHTSPHPGLHIEDVKDGTILANLPLEHDELKTGEVYDLTFDSENRFYLKIDRPGQHIQVPHNIIPLPLGRYSHTITREEPVPLPEPRPTLPYTLDANCEWVIDTKFRKICWIPPGDLRRGSGGHFWAGLSLVMVGDDGVVRKLSFKEPDY